MTEPVERTQTTGPPSTNLVARTVALSTALCGTAFIFPLLAAVGWTFDIPLLTQGGPGFPAMQPLTIVALVTGTIAILATPRAPVARAAG